MHYQAMQDNQEAGRVANNAGISNFEQWKRVLTEPPGWVFSIFIILFTVGLFLAGGPLTLLGMAAALFVMYKLFNYVKSHQRSEVTLAALIRYFNWACILLVAYLIGMVHWSFMSCYALVLLINIYFFCTSETSYEGFLKFFFIYPIDRTVRNHDPRGRRDTWATVNTISDCEWWLWIARLFFMALALGSTAITLGNIRVEPEAGEHAMNAFLSAGFCEELYKFLFSGTVSAISLYSQSRVAILQLSVGSAAGFTLMEDIIYALNSGIVTLMIRLLFFPLHICFNQVAALGIARQRQTWGSCFEIFFCFFAGVALHGAYDYMLFLQKPSWLFLISICVVAPLTCWSGYRAWMVGLRDPKFTPSNSEESARQQYGGNQLSDNAELPSGWEAVVDVHGLVAYKDVLNDVIQSDRPSYSSLPSGWSAQKTTGGSYTFKDPQGNVYYSKAPVFEALEIEQASSDV